jgi:uncharacterized protein (TIGR03435 family)
MKAIATPAQQNTEFSGKPVRDHQLFRPQIISLRTEQQSNPSHLYSRQEARTMPTRRTALLLTIILSASAALAQAPAPVSNPPATPPALKYDVISVKRDKPAETTQRFTYGPSPDGFTAQGTTLMTLLIYAYNIRPDYRITGAPSWADGTRYDIQAKVADADVAALQKLPYPQRAAMVQQVLTERFKITAHREVREQPIYSLVVSKPGVLTEEPAPADGKPVPMGLRPGRGDRAGQMVVTDLTTAYLAAQLSGSMGRMVIDNTGLTGVYHADLHWTLDHGHPASSDPTPDGTTELSIFTALQEQVGLKLVPTKGPVECLILDHVEQPSEN